MLFDLKLKLYGWMLRHSCFMAAVGRYKPVVIWQSWKDDQEDPPTGLVEIDLREWRVYGVPHE